MFAAEALALALVVAAPAAPSADAYEQAFELAASGDVVATVHAGCAGCAWGAEGREAAALRLSVDGVYSQHLLLARGETPADYRVTLGTLPAGHHRLSIERDRALSATGAGAATISVDPLQPIADRDAALAQSMAPILFARANTVGRFTDLPILMWYEVVPTGRGRQFRYSVIFTNEDGGTATDRLMATWGRTTDIEYVYGVELDRSGSVVAEQFQGPGHEFPPFTGRHEARHPLLWVSTDNNMVSESGSTTIRYAPAPERFDLTDASREAVMDRHPWSYALASEEMARERKIKDEGPGHNTIPDPRRYVYIEACGDVGDAALAFAVNARETWVASDRGVREYRIVRDGCFRGAIPLPAGMSAQDLRALRVMAYTRAPAKGQPEVRPRGPVRLRRVNTVFMLDDRYQPGPSMLQWQGAAAITPDGTPFDLPIR
jgi:hypothetical protein